MGFEIIPEKQFIICDRCQTKKEVNPKSDDKLPREWIYLEIGNNHWKIDRFIFCSNCRDFVVGTVRSKI